MKLAIQQAQKGLGWSYPNPSVGCIIVDKNQKVIGSGYHKKAGEPHAEVLALNSISDKTLLDGATVFVTLEPCSSQGRTPSCAHELAQYKSLKVIYGCKDPNPQMAGGSEVLKKQGISVEFLESMSQECEEIHEVFLHNMKQKKCFFHVKVASSLDGQMALQSGESQWITNEASRRRVQEMRGETQGVLIGRKTLDVDNPRLNSRHECFAGQQNKVVILDPNGKSIPFLKQKNISSVREMESIFIVIKPKLNINIEEYPFNIIECSQIKDSQFNLDELSVKLLNRGICSLLIEGGAETIGFFLSQKAIQRLSLFIAPKIIGGQFGSGWTKGVGVSKLDQALLMGDLKVIHYGSDLLISTRLQ